MDDYTAPPAAPQGALSQIREQAGGDPLLGQIQALMGGMNNPEQRSKDEWLAFGAGLGAPNPSGASQDAYLHGLGAQSAQRLETNKLQADYLKMILPQLVQNQNLQRQAVQTQREFLGKINPVTDSMLGGLLAGQNQPNYKPPTLDDAARVIYNVGAQNNAPQDWVANRLQELPRTPENLLPWLRQKLAGSAGAKEQLPTMGQNAAGQTVQQNASAGTVAPVTSGAAPADGSAAAATSDVGPNPSKVTVKASEELMGDPKAYEEALRGRVHAYGDMNQRLSAIAGNLSKITPGRYMSAAGGAAAAISDVSKYFPHIDKETVSNLVGGLLGARGQGNDAEALAAKQFADSLVVQEGVGQTRALLQGDSANSQRIGQREVQMITGALPRDLTDIGAYQKYVDFMRGQFANAVNKYEGWGQHVKSTPLEKVNVRDFDIPWEVNSARQMLKGQYGAMTPPAGSTNISPTTPVEGMPEPARRDTVTGGVASDGVRPPTPVAAAAKPSPVQHADLSQYEPGARVGPTGKVYVMRNGVPAPARLKGE